MVQSKAKNIVVSSSPSPSPLPSPRSAAPVARGQQQRAVKRSQPDNGAVRPYKKRMSRVVEDEETDEEDGGVPLPQEEEEEEEIAAGVAAAAAAAADDDDEDGGVLLDDGLGDDDYDDDEDCVDLEELDLNQLISQAELAELVDEETDEDEVSVPARARAPSVRTPGSSRPYSVIYDVEEYSALDLGPSALPEWFATMSSAEKQAGIQRARQMWIQYFEKTKKQADAFDFSNPDPDFPFSKGMVVTLRSGAWTAGKLADFVLSGKDEYGKYLDGLARLPTGGELKAIRAPTPEQLQGILVYTDLIERRQIEYRYGGSGTSRKDGASRLRQYELAKRLVMSGKSEEPKMDILSHMNVLLQKDSEAFWRLRASFSHATTTPKMVLLAEAAMIDFERTMSKDVPLAGTKSQFQKFPKSIRGTKQSQPLQAGPKQHYQRPPPARDLQCSWNAVFLLPESPFEVFRDQC
ncbi:hypothetical protein KC349_g9181 [Hortaea werneckii]|nr:hypothetical protein KC349_g9181 [Hortaea werneckii]